MDLRSKLFLFSFITGVMLALASCTGSPAVQSKTPLWVIDQGQAYPNSEWLCVVEREKEEKAAERAALSSLAQVFRVDLNSVTNANRQYAEAMGNAKGKSVYVSDESRDFAQDLVSTSTVSGLVGVQTETWESRDGVWYANARMNRRECSARYAAMIRENERVIDHLKEEAGKNPETFEAYEMLNLARSVALVTGNLHSLLTVLDPAAISRRLSYGNAEAVDTLAQNAARAIVITVNVNGIESDRITKAFTECFNSRGFRTNTTGRNPYILDASFLLEDVELENSPNKFVRYILNSSLRNIDGVEIFSFSENKREGHLTEAEARQRTLRAAEQSIGSTGFALKFDAFLASIL